MINNFTDTSIACISHLGCLGPILRSQLKTKTSDEPLFKTLLYKMFGHHTRILKSYLLREAA